MGADGGVCWVALHDASQYKRVTHLLMPFYFLTEYGNANWQEEANDVFRDANDFGPPKYLVGTYGSFQDFSIYEDLQEILQSEDQICLDPSLTFTELVDDLVCRPLMCYEEGSTKGSRWQYVLEGIFGKNLLYYYDVNGQHPSLLEAMLWEAVHSTYYVYGRAKAIDKLFPIADMRVCDWVDELKSLLDYKHVLHEETWT